jgi:RNA polymerase sigma-70 factor (ECF subfamily)
VTRSDAAGHPLSRPVSAAFGISVSDDADAEHAGPSLGDRLDAVYREHFSTVWRGLRRLGVPERSLEDAAQDVFLIVHRRANDFEGRSSVRTWIYGIAVRVAKDYRRAEARHSQRIQHLTAQLVAEPANNDSPADQAERREASRLLHAALGAMAEELRDVLVLVELEQLPVREAAIALGLRVRTCQRRLRAAHQAFETALAAHALSTRRSDD